MNKYSINLKKLKSSKALAYSQINLKNSAFIDNQGIHKFRNYKRTYLRFPFNYYIYFFYNPFKKNSFQIFEKSIKFQAENINTTSNLKIFVSSKVEQILRKWYKKIDELKIKNCQIFFNYEITEKNIFFTFDETTNLIYLAYIPNKVFFYYDGKVYINQMNFAVNVKYDEIKSSNNLAPLLIKNKENNTFSTQALEITNLLK